MDAVEEFRIDIPQAELDDLQERRLNSFPQFTTVIDGQTVHFLHVRSASPGALRGHFAAMEEPDLLVGDVREFFRKLR
jgi:Epoxide hydrolase N terminus